MEDAFIDYACSEQKGNSCGTYAVSVIGTVRVWHGFGNTRGFGPRVLPGKGKGRTFRTLSKPSPVRRVAGQITVLVLCEINYFGPWRSLLNTSNHILQTFEIIY